MAITEAPPTNLPEWATDGTNVGTPAPARIVSGWASGEIVAKDHLNWILNLLGQWAIYLYARVQSYATLQALYAGLSDQNHGNLHEPTVETWGSQKNTGVDGTARPFFLSGNGPFLVVATASGEPRVIARTTSAQGGGATTLFTLTRNTAATNAAIKCRGDYCVVGSGNRVDLFVISTGVRLWSYNHGAQINDVDIFGEYVFFCGVTSGGVRVARILISSGVAIADGYDPGATTVGICALPDGSVAFHTSSATGYGGTHSMELLEEDFTTVRWTKASTTSTIGQQLRTDGKALYMGEAAGNLVKINLFDGATIWDVILTAAAPAIRGVAVDHGGVYAVAWDGATVACRVRLDKVTGAIVWRNDIQGYGYVSAYADGAAFFAGIDASNGLAAFERGNRPGSWARVVSATAMYCAYPWLTQPVGEE
jgi:hypothetical protein